MIVDISVLTHDLYHWKKDTYNYAFLELNLILQYFRSSKVGLNLYKRSVCIWVKLKRVLFQ